MRKGLVLAVLGLALTAVPSSSAVPAELPRGWWKGTIVLHERWDQLTQSGISRYSEKGSATLRVERTAPKTASYEFGYRQETRRLNGDCPGELTQHWTSSVTKTAPISVDVSDGRPGAYFSVAPGLNAAVDGVGYTCGAYPEKYDAGELSLNFDFTSKQSHGATARRGVGPTQRPVFYGRFEGKPRPGGVNTSRVTWDLELVSTAAPKAGAPVGLECCAHAKTIPDILQWRRGSTVQWIVTGLRLVDDARATVAPSSRQAGCELVYFYNAFKGGKKVVTLLAKSAARGTWSAGRLACKWRLPDSGPVDAAVAGYKKVHVAIGPWVTYRGKRYWNLQGGFGTHAPRAMSVVVLPRIPKR